jgi:hypothetical protein
MSLGRTTATVATRGARRIPFVADERLRRRRRVGPCGRRGGPGSRRAGPCVVTKRDDAGLAGHIRVYEHGCVSDHPPGVTFARWVAATTSARGRSAHLETWSVSGTSNRPRPVGGARNRPHRIASADPSGRRPNGPRSRHTADRPPTRPRPVPDRPGRDRRRPSGPAGPPAPGDRSGRRRRRQGTARGSTSGPSTECPAGDRRLPRSTPCPTPEGPQRRRATSGAPGAKA